MELLNDLYPLIQPYMTGAVKAVIVQSVRLGARRWCRETGGWRSTHTQDSDKDELTYTFTLDSYDAIMLRVVSVNINGSQYDLEEDDYTVADDRLSITLQNAPSSSETDGMVIVISMIPELNAEQLSNPFFDRWFEAILAAAKADMYKQPMKPYTDLTQYDLCNREFTRAAGNMKVENFRQARTSKNRIKTESSRTIWGRSWGI